MRIAFTHNLMMSSAEDHAEFDSPATVALIAESLLRLGHDVELIEVSGSLTEVVRRLEEGRPELVLNTAEGSRGRAREGLCPAIFERLGIPYIGSDAYTCTLTLDKQLCKDIVSARGVSVAPSALVTHVAELRTLDVPLPAIVKPNYEGSSKGISSASIAETDTELRAIVGEVLSSYPDGVIVESYIAGTDVVVPFIEGISAATGGVLEPASYSYRCVTAGRHRIYDGAMKRDGFDGLHIECPARVAPETRREIIVQAATAYRALGVRDLGRIDFRVDHTGRPFFLEVNALPSLEDGASIFLCGAQVGVQGIDAVLDAVIASATRRWGMVAPIVRSARAH